MKTTKLIIRQSLSSISIFILAILFITPILNSCKEQEPLISAKIYTSSNDGEVKDMPIENLFSIKEVIKIKDVQGSKVTSLYETDKYYYIIFDEKFINRYNKEGELLNNIGANGNGPGEYLYPNNICKDSDNNLYVFDFPAQKLLKYSENGEYISTSKPESPTEGSYFKSFFTHKDSMIFYELSNSTTPELLKYNKTTNALKNISKKERDMLPDEVMLGGIYTFGEMNDPYIYNTFNDTIFKLKEDKLYPVCLLKQGELRFKFEELNMQNLVSFNGTRLTLEWFAAADEYIFISYGIASGAKNKSQKHLALYNVHSGEYSQDIELTSSNTIENITSETKLFSGVNSNELIKVHYSEEDEIYINLVKYSLK